MVVFLRRNGRFILEKNIYFQWEYQIYTVVLLETARIPDGVRQGLNDDGVRIRLI